MLEHEARTSSGLKIGIVRELRARVSVSLRVVVANRVAALPHSVWRQSSVAVTLHLDNNTNNHNETTFAETPVPSILALLHFISCTKITQACMRPR